MLDTNYALGYLIGGCVMFRGFTSLFGRFGRKSRLVELALNNMTQGVVLFDAAGRLVVRNERYIEIYGLPRNLVKPGVRLIDLVMIRAKSGNLPTDPEKYCADLMRDMAAAG